MESDALKATILKDHPEWSVNVQESARAYWIEVSTGRKNFSMQFVPGLGIGVSERREDDLTIDFSGHDIQFSTLNEAIAFVAEQAKTGFPPSRE